MIDEMWVITTLLTLVASLFGVLIALLAWMGNKVYNKISEMASAMHNIEVDLHGKISDLDRRMTVVETVCAPACTAHIKRRSGDG